MGTETHGRDRPWSWAASADEVETRRRAADALVGQRVRAVRYVTLDYCRYELRPDLIGGGPRRVDADDEWLEPTWLEDGFDAVVHGLELETGSGAVFSLTWDSPGVREGIGLHPFPLLGTAVRQDADVAIWDVGERATTWARTIGAHVTGVDLHYVPWDEHSGSFWCPRITIRCGDALVEIVMGDSEGTTLVPSADNVAVLHPGASLPAWLA